MPLIPVLGRWRQENQELRVIFGCIVSESEAKLGYTWDCLTPPTKNKTKRKNIYWCLL